MSLNIGRSSEGEIEHEDGIYIIMQAENIYNLQGEKINLFFVLFGCQKGAVTRTKDF